MHDFFVLVGLWLVVMCVTGVLLCRNPGVSVASHWAILSRQIDTVAGLVEVIPTSLREGPGAGRKFGRHGSVRRNPVCQSVFAVLDDRLARVIAIVRRSSFAGCDWSVVNEFQEMFPIAGDDCKLLAMLAKGIKLIGESGLDLFASDVGQLSLGNEGFCFRADKLLF